MSALSGGDNIRNAGIRGEQHCMAGTTDKFAPIPVAAIAAATALKATLAEVDGASRLFEARITISGTGKRWWELGGHYFDA